MPSLTAAPVSAKTAWGATPASRGRPAVVAAATRFSEVQSPVQINRRRLGAHLLSAAAAALAAGGVPAAPAVAAPTAGGSLTPYQRGLQLEYGLVDGRIRTCPTDANPNCVSTSSTNTTYMPAWEAPQGRLADAMAQLEAALLEVAPEAQLVASSSGPASEYRRWAVSDRLFDHDDIEVLISLQRPPYEQDPPLVTFRSMAAQVKYIWPIQQPVTDFGAQRQRLKLVRQRLGWRLLGCDLLECYEE